METICIKLEDNLLKKMDENLKKHHFSTRSEFIRALIREKVKYMSSEDIIREFMKFRGKAKKKTTYEENRRTREQVSKELMEELDKKFNK